MNPSPPDNVAALRKRVSEGNLAAHDELATLLFNLGDYAESAELYLKAYVSGFYKYNERPRSSENLRWMLQKGLVTEDTDTARIFKHLQSEEYDNSKRASNAAVTAGIVVFIAYTILVYAGGIIGILRDASLFIAAGLAWLAWKMVISNFEQ